MSAWSPAVRDTSPAPPVSPEPVADMSLLERGAVQVVTQRPQPVMMGVYQVRGCWERTVKTATPTERIPTPAARGPLSHPLGFVT